MFDGPDLDEATRLVDEWQAGMDRRAAGARALARRLGTVTAAARSDDGLVSVTLDSSGRLTGLVLREGIRDRPAAATAASILATVRAAAGSLAAQVRAAADETVGAGSATGRAVLAAYECAERGEPADA